MGSRGRVSAAALSVISSSGIEQIRRPAPPASLSGQAADEWKAIVNRMPPDWFPRETHGLLVQYCRLIVRASQIAELMSTKKMSVIEFQRLLRMEQQLSDSLARLATKMRMSQQSTYDQTKKKRFTPQNQPWDDEEVG